MGMTSEHRSALVADIGGTNARFALAQDDGTLAALGRYAVSAFSGPTEAANAFLQEHGAPPIGRAALAVAGPVTGDRVRLTNHPWDFSQRALREALGLDTLIVVNDLVAAAAAIPVLPREGAETVAGGDPLAGAPLAMLAPGTGLGTALLVPADRGASSFLAVPAEGGHATLPPRDEFESALLARARLEFAHVSAERLVSGMGLPLLYRLIAAETGAVAPLDSAAAIADAAGGGDALAQRTIRQFCAFLGTVAGDLILSTGARGGLYLGGGILPQWGRLFAVAAFRERMIDKGRQRGFLEPVPVSMVTDAMPALRGLAAILEDRVRVAGLCAAPDRIHLSDKSH